MTDAWCPFAVHRPITEAETQPYIVPRAVIAHSQAGTGSLYGFWENGSSLESHFWVSQEGVIEEYMPCNRRADANLNANSFAISIETENSPEAVKAGAWDTDPWTPAQLAAILRLCQWLHETWAIPAVQIDNAYGSGFGWHVMFGAPGPWTPVAKACPGRARIEQFRNDIIPAIGVPAPVPSVPQEGFMAALTDTQQSTLAMQVAAIDQRTQRLEQALLSRDFYATNSRIEKTWAGRVLSSLRRLEEKVKATP